MALPALAQAPATNGGYQSLVSYSDQFVTPVEIKGRSSESEIVIVGEAYILNVPVLLENPKSDIKPENRGERAIPPPDFYGYLQSIATPEEVTLLTKIAYCESHFQQKWNYKYELDPDYYTAYGYFQITAGTAKSTDATLDRTKPLDNILLAVKLYRNRGTQPWILSSSCWQG